MFPTFLVPRLANLFGFTGPECKVAIIGLDGVGKYTLLRRLSQEAIQTFVHPSQASLDFKTGKSYRWNMNFVQTYVGYSEKALRKKWLANQFCDADGIIFVIDDHDGSRVEEVDWMELYAHGFVPLHGSRDFYIRVKEGIPWLVLGNKKKGDSSSMTVEEIRRTMELDSLAIDWHVEVVNILTGEGVDEALSWLRRRINTPSEER